MQTLAAKDVKEAFETGVTERFGVRLQRLEWRDDDPYEASGERLRHVLHAALHLKRATPDDIDAAADLACAVEEQFDDTYTILSHTLPVAI